MINNLDIKSLLIRLDAGYMVTISASRDKQTSTAATVNYYCIISKHMSNPDQDADSPNRAAEQLLIERGVYEHQTLARQVLLGCIACQWERCVTNDEYPEYTNVQLARCSDGRLIGSVSKVSQQLLDAGLVSIGKSPFDRTGQNPTSRNPQNYYRPSNTLDGIKFQDLLVPPETCLRNDHDST